MQKRYIRASLALIVIVATVIGFVYYFRHHPEVGDQLGRTSPGLIALLLVLYFGVIVALALMNESTVRLCRVKMKLSESFLLTAYTAVINFFGPLQSGPAVRAVYLKKKYSINLKNYGIATLVYYFFFAAFSGLFLLSGVLHWWLVPLIVLGLLVMIAILKSPQFGPKLRKLDLGNWYYLAAATLLQVALTAVIYYAELHSIDPSISLNQAIIYTGAANFAMFVSITPGAIGFREAFLVFSQNLHHVPNSTIVAANILDRAVYIILLILLAVFIFGFHAKKQLGLPAKE
jgi:uncharacterized membrane protein YbhN (UPF0104 family)